MDEGTNLSKVSQEKGMCYVNQYLLVISHAGARRGFFMEPSCSSMYGYSMVHAFFSPKTAS